MASRHAPGPWIWCVPATLECLFLGDLQLSVQTSLQIGSDTIYGRNWGCSKDIKFLHFEVCYYQAIEEAIATGMARVEAGAQGEHKIQRGYLPTKVNDSYTFDSFKTLRVRMSLSHPYALRHEACTDSDSPADVFEPLHHKQVVWSCHTELP